MATSTTIAAAATVALLKRAIDDIYTGAKELSINIWGKARADVKEQPIARALASVIKVKTLWNIDKEVSLYEFYYPSIVEFNDEVKKRIDSIRSFGRNGHFVIQGTAGQGKSIFLRYLCGQELNPKTTSDRIPIFIELRRITNDHGVIQLILQALERFKLPHSLDSWKYLAGSGKFVMLFDAFDEVDPSLTQRTLAEIEHLAALYKDNLQIIITSRPDADIQNSTYFRVFKLSPLTASDHSPFLKKICTDKEQAQSLEKVIKASSSEVTGLLTTPLMMTLLVILYKSLQTVPDTIPRFYEELFDVLFYRHDHSKPGFRRKRFTQLDDQSVKRLFSAFCFFYRLQGLGVLNNSEFTSCCEQACAATSINVDARALRNELIKTICLIQEEGFEISFIHKSVAQYYAASFVSKSGDDFAEQFYSLASTNNQWALEIRFLSQIDSYRFNKLYEIPLLRKVAADFNVSIDFPDPIEELKISDFLGKRVSLVTIRENENGEKKDRVLGWSAGNNVTETRAPWTEFAYPFVDPVFQAIEKRTLNFPGHIAGTENNPNFISVSEFAEFAKYNPRVGARNVMRLLRERHTAATKIIDTEGRKTAMLSSFIKKTPQ